MKISGYEVICPDGKARHYPYFNEGDANFEAEHIIKNGCSSLNDPVRTIKTVCPGGTHTVRPLVFELPEHTEN